MAQDKSEEMSRSKSGKRPQFQVGGTVAVAALTRCYQFP